jgi:putative membrane protein
VPPALPPATTPADPNSDPRPDPAPAPATATATAPAPATAPVSSGPAPDGWIRLSSRALAVRPVTDLLRSAPVLIGAIYEGARGHHTYWGLAFGAFAVLSSIWRWFGTKYQVTDERVYVRRGLLAPRILSTPRSGVRSVDLTAHAIYRMLGVAEVKIGTGRNDKRETEGFKLNALRVTDADALRTLLLTSSTTAQRSQAATAAGPAGAADAADAAGVTDSSGVSTAPQPPHETEVVRLRLAWIRFAPLTLTGLVILGVLVGFGSQAERDSGISLTSLGPVHTVTHDLSQMSLGEAIPLSALLLLVALVIISILGYAAVFWDFRLLRTGDGALRVTRGLISTRATTIDESRVRGAELSEPLSLRLAGGARCLAITTGLRVGGGAERGGSVLLPPAPRAVAYDVAAGILDAPRELFCAPLTPHGRAALRRREIRALVPLLVLYAAAVLTLALTDVQLPLWIAFVPVILCVLGVLLGRDRYRGLGHRLAGEWIVLSTGSLVRRRSVLNVHGIVGWTLRQSWFQRRRGLVSVTATTAAGKQHYTVADLPMAEALALIAAATPEPVTQFLDHPPRPAPTA